MRVERDFIGSIQLEDAVLYGIHAARARENFPDSTPFPVEWYKALGFVKRACYETYAAFSKASEQKYPGKVGSLNLISHSIVQHLIHSATEVSEGDYFDHFIVPAISGGAGTSINMNVNEIIANASLLKMGEAPGTYSIIDPIEQANVFQSTNDVIPTSLKVAMLFLLQDLESALNQLREVVEEKEGHYRNDLRMGYTQMQEAVPTSFGKLFSTYSEAFSRDWWRISKCFERLKLVNLGGGAAGTGLAIPRFFIMEATATLQKLTGLPIARSENLADATANLDSFVEVHAILKAHAVNLEKMVNDLRLLSSDIANRNQHGTSRLVSLPEKQVGSSIMPGKVNPVIPEFVVSAAHCIYSNDQLVASLAAQGCLELNAYLPVIGCSIIESLKLMISMNKTLKANLWKEMVVQTDVEKGKIYFSATITTALIPYIGYHQAAALAKRMKEEGISVQEANEKLNLISPDQLKDILAPERLLQLGYTLNDVFSEQG